MPEERTFTEAEAYAIASERAAAVNAELTAKIEELSSENERLTVELSAAQGAVEAAKQELEDYKAEQARQAELAELAEARTKAYREAAPHLSDDFFTPERAARWASMGEDAFAGLIEEIASIAAKPEAKVETAMKGEPVRVDTGSLVRSFLMEA